jgi:CBS domain-containing protein
MQPRTNTRLARGLFLDRDIDRLRQQIVQFHPFLSRKRSSVSLEDFDAASERLISRVFGEASELLEAYEYAKFGEAAGLVNLPEEAQESGARDVERESLQQRKRVLECCISTLQSIRQTRVTVGRVADYMSRELRSVPLDATLKEAAKLLKKWTVGSLLVDDGRRYVGIITDTDLSRKGTARGLDPSVTTVNVCMSKPIISIEDTESMPEAVALMKQSGIRHLGVTVNGTIMGVLSVADVLRYYADLVPTLTDLAKLTAEQSEIAARE